MLRRRGRILGSGKSIGGWAIRGKAQFTTSDDMSHTPVNIVKVVTSIPCGNQRQDLPGTDGAFTTPNAKPPYMSRAQWWLQFGHTPCQSENPAGAHEYPLLQRRCARCAKSARRPDGKGRLRLIPRYFFLPCIPTLAVKPPAGGHEIKHDG
jgi:hypothetical protein